MKPFTIALLLFCLFGLLLSPTVNAAEHAASATRAGPVHSNAQEKMPHQGMAVGDETCNKADEFTPAAPQSVIRRIKSGEVLRPSYLELGRFVTVEVPDDKYLVFTKQEDNVQPTPLLYINGFAVNGLTWVSSGCKRFSFLLTRTAESREVWGKEIAKLDGKDNIPIGIGTAQKGFVADIGTGALVLTSGHWIVWWFGLMVILIVALFWLGISSGLLRDLPKRAAADAGMNERPSACERPFSLARVQMAFWFVLAVGAYVYIWLKTGDISNTVPASILALIGISGGTTVLSAVVDSTTTQQPEWTTHSLVRDILMDQDGVSFHRFQMVVWTIVLGAVFIQKVVSTLIMPDFDAELLGLMGVASGTYLGFKIPAAMTAGSAASPSAAGSDQPPAMG